MNLTLVSIAVAACALLGITGPAFAADNATAAADKGIKIIKDLAYTSEKNARQTLDLYLPEKSTGRLPLVILIHGGGWAGGNKEAFAGTAEAIAKRGYATASINYRLTDTAAFPAQITDCKAAVRWLRSKADEYGFDSKRFVVMGHSAGGHLSSLMAVTNGVKKFDVGDNLKTSSDVQACVWIAGVSDFVSWVLTPGFEGLDVFLKPLLGGPALENRDKALQASPICYANKKSSPIIFFHGDKDQLVPATQAIELYLALERAGVYSELHIKKGTDHVAPGFYTPEMYQQMDAFLAKVLKTAPKPAGK